VWFFVDVKGEGWILFDDSAKVPTAHFVSYTHLYFLRMQRPKEDVVVIQWEKVGERPPIGYVLQKYSLYSQLWKSCNS
jgi:hypothetical protein